MIMERPAAEDEKLLFKALKKIEFFSFMPVRCIDRVLEQFVKVSVRKNKTVIRQGKPGEALYVIGSGCCGVFRRTGLFSKKKLAELGVGDFFGEMSLIYDAPTSADVKTLENAELFKISRYDFYTVLEDQPEVVALVKKIADERKGQP
jgi:CRP-like cAMP-binding protein